MYCSMRHIFHYRIWVYLAILFVSLGFNFYSCKQNVYFFYYFVPELRNVSISDNAARWWCCSNCVHCKQLPSVVMNTHDRSIYVVKTGSDISSLQVLNICENNRSDLEKGCSALILKYVQTILT